jgi:hypothetical protein
MPDGRFVSRGIAQSEQLGEVSLEADYLFTRCIPHLDRDGRMSGNPTLIKATACPLRPEITAGSIPDLVRTLSGAGLVHWYEADGKQVLEFPKFRAHQKGMKYEREAASRFPAFDCDTCTDLAAPEKNGKSGPTPDEVRTNSGSGPPKLSEVKSKLSSRDSAPTFADFWTSYPKRAGNAKKGTAEAAWKARLQEGTDPVAIMAGLERYREYVDATGKSGTELVMMAATFLSKRDRPWEQEWTPPPPPDSESRRTRNELPGRDRGGQQANVDLQRTRGEDGIDRVWNGNRWVPTA